MGALTGMSKVVVATADVAQVAAQRLVEYQTLEQQRTGAYTVLAPGDPRRLFILAQAARETQLRNLINYAYNANYLPWATGAQLDAIGTRYGARGLRLQAASATTTLQFNLTQTLNADALIPQGTQVSTGAAGGAVFATDEDHTIGAGLTTGTVGATAITAGTAANGYVAGQVATLINTGLPFVGSVQNLTTTANGADVEPDDEYRNRLYLAIDSYSVAGSRGAYVFFALSANPLVTDVAAWSPVPGTVRVDVIGQNGALPDAGMLAEVATGVSPQTVRPLTDNVVVSAPPVYHAALTVTYYVAANAQGNLATLQTAINNAITSWLTWQQTKIGRSINPDYLRQLCLEAGASRAWVQGPAYANLAGVPDQYATVKVAFNTPAVGANVTVTVDSSAWVLVGHILYLYGVGFYQVTAVPTGTTLTLTDLGSAVIAGNAAANTLVQPSSYLVAPRLLAVIAPNPTIVYGGVDYSL